jgi:hypothetical protein
VTRPAPTTIYSSPPECNLPATPERLGPSGGQAETDETGKETGYVRVPASWFVRVYQVISDENDWRRAATSCMEAGR